MGWTAARIIVWALFVLWVVFCVAVIAHVAIRLAEVAAT